MWPSSNGYEPLGAQTAHSSRIVRSRLLVSSAVLTGIMTLFTLQHFSDTDKIATLLHRPVDTCSPYDQPGMLLYDPHNAHANRWTPFAGIREDRDPIPSDLDVHAPRDPCTQPAPALAAAFVRASWDGMAPSQQSVLGIEWALADKGPDGQAWEDVEFARNRTVIHIGDSISRFTTKYFCDMVGEPYIELTWGHPWSPAEVKKDGSTAEEPERHDEDLDPFGWNRLKPGSPGSHIAHYCYVPGTDFLLLHVHMYGLDEDDYWAGRSTYIPPYSFEDRTYRLVKEYINRIRATTGRTSAAPELIYTTSAMWDVMRFAHEDVKAGISVATSLGTDRLAWYRRRVREALTFLGRQFPDASLYWSAAHYPIRPSNGWFFHDVNKDQNKAKQRPDVKLLRLRDMHDAAVSAFQDTQDATAEDKKILDGVQLNRWGLAIQGQEEHQIDDLHPTFLPGGYLWADMALYDLRREVQKRGL